MTFLNTVIPKIIGFTIDCVLDKQDVPNAYAPFVAWFGGIEHIRNSIWLVALVITAIAVVMLLLRYCSIYFTHRANQVLMRRMRDTLFTHIQRLPMSWHAKNNTGDIIQR